MQRRMVVLATVVGFVACSGGDPPGDGGLNVQIQITAAPSGDLAPLKRLRLRTVRVDVVHRTVDDDPSTERIITVSTVPGDVGVPIVRDTITEIGLLSVPPGFVEQIRFVFGDVEAQFGASTLPVKTPSGEETGLKIIPMEGTSFKVESNRFSEIVAMADPNDRMVYNRGQGLILKPTVRAVQLPPPANPDPPPQFVPGQVYVCFHEGTTTTRMNEIHAAIGATVLRTSARHPWQVVQVPGGASESDTRDLYRMHPEVALAMLNYNIHSENRMPSEWTTANRQEYLRKNQSPAAWDRTVGDYTPIVAVVDSNINIFNHDLSENIFLNQDEIPTQVIRDRNCHMLATPIPLPTVNTDADSIITLKDLNTEPNFTTYRNAIAMLSGTPPAHIALEHLLLPGDDRCGLWEDGIDGDPANGRPANGHVDDIAGWDFIYDRNTSVGSLLSPGSAPDEGTGHGHEVAGILGAVSDELSLLDPDSLSHDYVGQTWRVRILPVRVNSGSTPLANPSSLFGSHGVYHDGLSYAVDMHADVVNMSFSLICVRRSVPGVPEGLYCNDDEFDRKTADYRASFDLAGLRSQPLVVVGPIDHPVSLDKAEVLDLPAELMLDNQINVGSTKLDDTYDTRVSWGPHTYHIAAPSEHMPTLNFGGAGTVTGTTIREDGVTGDLSAGTSLAAPQVSGTAALILTVSPELRGNPTGLKNRILRNADVIDGITDRVQNGRRLNVFNAVNNTH